MAIQLDPPRSIAPISSSDPNSIVTSEWLIWFQAIYQILATGTQTTGTPLNVTGQGGAIGLSTLPLPSLQNGRYRINWFIQITGVAATSSSVQLTIGFTHNAVPLTKTFAAITGNTIFTFDQDSMYVLIDPNTPITYQTTYASTPAGQMTYQLAISVESV